MQQTRQFKRVLLWILGAALVGVLQFVACVAIVYAQRTDDFTFSSNFLSDLGITKYPLSWLYSGSLAMLGLTQIPLFASLTFLDPRKSMSMRSTSVFGVLASLGLVFLGLTPFDTMYFLHHVSLALWLFPMFYCWVAFFFAASRSPYVGIGFLSTSLAMVILLMFVLLRSDVDGFELMQKCVIVCGFVWLVFVFGFVCQSAIQILRDLRAANERQSNRKKRQRIS